MPQSSKKFKQIQGGKNDSGPMDDDKLFEIINKNATYTANVVDSARKNIFPVIKSAQGY